MCLTVRCCWVCVCDKIVPGLLIGALHYGHLPCVFVPAGPMGTGLSNKDKAKVREQYAQGLVGRDELLKAESAAYHSPGTCTFYGTANSNQMLLEAMGLHVPGAAFEAPGTEAREAFTMSGRTRRPPLDRMNALLSFLYAMLMNDVRSAVESVGLDPQIGFLHAVRPGRAALALDLMEEFRSFADRLALSLINRGQIGADGFVEREGGAVLLEGDARKAVLVAYQERKQEALTHPLLAETVPFGLLPHVQARLLARTLRGDTDQYLPYLVR